MPEQCSRLKKVPPFKAQQPSDDRYKSSSPPPRQIAKATDYVASRQSLKNLTVVFEKLARPLQ
ncbi:hypothetical protein THL1_5379 [Pseudomonas sp. TCU-HL1]|nr:hypothetical protein THL1_5379 [Pseudomonas sp. TCU-HL1]